MMIYSFLEGARRRDGEPSGAACTGRPWAFRFRFPQ
jgi:hypothetical protein